MFRLAARSRVGLLVLVISGCVTSPEVKQPRSDDPAQLQVVAAALDDLHDAAAHADEARYFGHFSAQAVFLGTDATERWDLPAFQAYAHPHFAKGSAWTFHATRRSIRLSDDGQLAWFDEDLATEKLGPARGSGVLRRRDGQWKIEQYNLALTIPNGRVAEIRALLDAEAPNPFPRRNHAAYGRAVAAAERGDLPGAERELSAMVEEAEGLAGDATFWIHNDLTWLRWAQGDLAGAVKEVDRAQATLMRSHLPAAAIARTALHAQWDRAYLLLEVARQTPAPLATAANQAADAARVEYETAATPLKDHDGMAVLAAFFAARRGDAEAALEAARRVKDADDDDLQDLYVLALAYDVGHQPDLAAKLRLRIASAKSYLMKPLIVRQLELDRASQH